MPGASSPSLASQSRRRGLLFYSLARAPCRHRPQHLESLWLGGHAIGDAGAAALAAALAPRADGGAPLHTLALFSNRIGAPGRAALGAALKAREHAATAPLGPASVTLFDNNGPVARAGDGAEATEGSDGGLELAYGALYRGDMGGLHSA